MKEVMAVIRMDKMNKTKEALLEAGVPAFFARAAEGRGKGLVNSALLQGAAQGIEEAAALLGEKGRLYPKRVITVVVEDDKVEDVVEAIVEVNRTGKPGDGKIFVCPMLDAVRVRTGESGEKSIA